MKKLLFLMAVVLLVGCTDVITDIQSILVLSTKIGAGNFYGKGKENIPGQNLVIYNSLAWTELIGKMNLVNNETRNFTETNIDFSKFMVLAIFDEVKGSGGYSINITDILENQDNLTVTVQQTTPTGNAYAVMTQPYCIVKIPITAKQIIFN